MQIDRSIKYIACYLILSHYSLLCASPLLEHPLCGQPSAGGYASLREKSVILRHSLVMSPLPPIRKIP